MKTCNVTWYKNSTVLTDSSECRTSFDGSVSTLTISSTKISHSATYRVVFKNEFGSDESSAELKVNEKKVEEKKKKEEEKVHIYHIYCYLRLFF